MKLLKEFKQNVNTLNREENGEKKFFIEGIFMQSNIKNQNGRIYPKEIMENEVARFSKDMIATRRALGELEHSDSPNIQLDRASHLIEALEFSGDDIVGRAKILDTANGQLVKALIKEGIQLGVSSRGLGSIKMLNNGAAEVQDDFHLVTVDIVSDPSAPSALVEGLMEGREWVYDAIKGIYKEKACQKMDEAKKHIKTISSKQLEEESVKLFRSLMEGFARN